MIKKHIQTLSTEEIIQKVKLEAQKRQGGKLTTEEILEQKNIITGDRSMPINV